jgi:hypothetical protein
MSLSDEYCTPKWLADCVGTFDTDPCTNERSHIRARTKYSLPTNGLQLPWQGRVWLNHPYSNPLPWMEKLYYEQSIGRCTESLVLAKLDPSTEWWKVLTSQSCVLWVFKKRIQFEPPLGIKASSNNFCSVLVHHRGATGDMLNLDDVAQLWRC